MEHQAVLLKEAVNALLTNRNGIYVDATFGRGGHSKKILESLGPQGRLVVLDKDPQAIEVALTLATTEPRLTVLYASFSRLQSLLKILDIKKIDGVLFDFGVSSPQLDDPKRGFSFRHQSFLDMRMNPNDGLSAREWLQQVSQEKLAQGIKDYGEERHHKKIAHAVVAYRQKAPIDTTQTLADIVKQSIKARKKNQHPATRTFQAIRIEINHELEEIKAVLPQVAVVLKEGGRLVSIAFHSLEDRLIKRFIKGSKDEPEAPKWAILRSNEMKQQQPPLRAIGRPIRASQAEIAHNTRASSAIMRVAERCFHDN